MTEIITIPAGTIMPRDLLMWLKRRLDETRAEMEQLADDYSDADTDERWMILNERAQTYSEVIQHVSFGRP